MSEPWMLLFVLTIGFVQGVWLIGLTRIVSRLAERERHQPKCEICGDDAVLFKGTVTREGVQQIKLCAGCAAHDIGEDVRRMHFGEDDDE